jgi:hypothetical protein
MMQNKKERHMKYVLAIAAVMITTPVSAGDYIIYDCKVFDVMLSIPAKGDIAFYEYLEKPKPDGTYVGRELPKRLFIVKDNGRRVYYRGKLCIELDE